MTLSIQLLANGDTNYVTKHNANLANIKAAVEALQALLSAQISYASGPGGLLNGQYGSDVALLGGTSYEPSESGSTLTVAAGAAWIPSASTVVLKASSTAFSFVGQPSDTYYITADASGNPVRSTDSTDALWSVEWDGADLTDITRIAAVFWNVDDQTDALTSTALGASYGDLRSRLEAGESLIMDAELQAIAGLTSAANKIPYFTGSGTAALLTRDTDGTLAANSDTSIATQKAVKTYVDGIVSGGAVDVMVFKGVIDCSADPNYPAADAGHLYKVSVAGQIGGGSGPNVEAGDTLYCITDSTASGTHAGVGANWVIAQVNVDGLVTGPGSAVDEQFALFDGTTGKILKDSGLSFDTDDTLAADSDLVIPSQKAVKAYVDAVATSASPWKESVRVATTASGSIGSDYEDGDTVDGVVLATGDRILIKDLAGIAAPNNGIRIVQASGTPLRSSDCDHGDEVFDMLVVVREGTANANTIWHCATAGPITIDSTDLEFEQIGSSSSGTTGKHAIYIAAGSMKPSASGGCAALAAIASAANQPDITTLDFDPTTQEYAQFGIVMPKAWDEGPVTFKPHWSHPATTTNFGTVWDLQAVAVSDDDAIAAAFGTAQTSTDTGGTTNDLYTGPESSAITVAGTPAAEDMVFFRLSRVTGNGSDTMAVDARLHGITLYITTDAENDA
jgi:hypothetical protein